MLHQIGFERKPVTVRKVKTTSDKRVEFAVALECGHSLLAAWPPRCHNEKDAVENIKNRTFNCWECQKQRL